MLVSVMMFGLEFLQPTFRIGERLERPIKKLGDILPATTMVEVKRLIRSEFRVEMEADAVVT